MRLAAGAEPGVLKPGRHAGHSSGCSWHTMHSARAAGRAEQGGRAVGRAAARTVVAALLQHKVPRGSSSGARRGATASSILAICRFAVCKHQRCTGLQARPALAPPLGSPQCCLVQPDCEHQADGGVCSRGRGRQQAEALQQPWHVLAPHTSGIRVSSNHGIGGPQHQHPAPPAPTAASRTNSTASSMQHPQHPQRVASTAGTAATRPGAAAGAARWQHPPIATATTSIISISISISNKGRSSRVRGTVAAPTKGEGHKVPAALAGPLSGDAAVRNHSDEHACSRRAGIQQF